MSSIVEGVKRDAEALAMAGFDSVLVENFGDAPFFKSRVPAETVAAMTLAADAARRASGLTLGVNVLRNDGTSAIAIAAAVDAAYVRVNVLVGARVTDQGLIEGEAAQLQRLRVALQLHSLAIVADVDVKHSSALGAIPIDDEALEAVERGLAEAVIVSGQRTGGEASREAVLAVKQATRAAVWLGSGVRRETAAAWLEIADGAIVGSDLRANGRAGGPIDVARAKAFAAAARGTERNGL